MVVGLSELRMNLASASGLRVTLRLSGLLSFLLEAEEEEEDELVVEEDLVANLSAKMIRAMRRPMPPTIARREAMMLCLLVLLLLGLQWRERFSYIAMHKEQSRCA